MSENWGDWSVVRKDRQRRGPIRMPRGNRDVQVLSGHNNRAGHRHYVRVNQTRNNRLHLVGWGRWRKHDEHGDKYDTARATALTEHVEPRAKRRPRLVAEAKQARREAARALREGR
jgi:hypothetical protein